MQYSVIDSAASVKQKELTISAAQYDSDLRVCKYIP